MHEKPMECPQCKSKAFTVNEDGMFYDNFTVSIPAVCKACGKEVVIVFEPAMIFEDI